MRKEFHLLVRKGDEFKISRIIRSKEDADRAVEAVRTKLEVHKVKKAVLYWKWEGLQSNSWVEGPGSYSDVISHLSTALLLKMLAIGMVEVSSTSPRLASNKVVEMFPIQKKLNCKTVAAEVCQIRRCLYSAIDELEAGNMDEVRYYLSEIGRELNIAMMFCPPMPAVSLDDQEIIQRHASEIWSDTDDLLTVCHLLQQSVLRTREMWSDNAAVEVALDPVLDTQELLDRRIRKLRDQGKAICKLLDAA